MPFNTQLSDDILITAEAPTATGTSTISSTALDMAGFTGVLFIARLGSPGADRSIKAQEDTVVGMGSAQDLQGSAVVSGANNTVVLEFMYPQKQFVRCQVVRTTTTTIDSLIAIRFGARVRPTALGSSISFESWQGPIEGTA